MAGGRSLVRLDPVHRGERIEVWQARAYSVPVDPLLPLEQMMEPYTAVATVTIDAGTAYVQGMHGKMSRAIMRSFRARLRAIGVSPEFTERPKAVRWNDLLANMPATEREKER